MNTFASVCLALTVVTAARGQGRDYVRSMVITHQGIAATSQVLASQAGAGILAKGGSAADAAIASNSLIQSTHRSAPPATTFIYID